MEDRDVLKKVVHFAKWEYKEKRPKTVKVMRLKSKTVFSLGVLPDLQMRTIGPIRFVVVSDYGDTLMIYFFNRYGERVGGKNYDPTLKFLKKLDKSTTVKYQLPKKELIDMVDDTIVAQQEINKIHQHISNKLGISHKYPYTILVKRELSFITNDKLGCKRVKKELYIPLELINKSYLEFLATVEWFYSYLTSLINIPKVGNNQDILSDLAILLSAIFNLKFVEKIKNLNFQSHEITIRDKKFNLAKDFKCLLSSLTRIPSKMHLSVPLKNYCTVLQLLKHYRISLSHLEVIQLYSLTCEIFNIDNDTYTFIFEEKFFKSYYFYFRIFSRAHEISKDLQLEQLEFKTFLLSYIFGLYILEPEEINRTPYTLTEVIDNVRRLIKDPEVYNEILRLDEFVSDMIANYILKYLKFITIYDVENGVLEIVLEIENQSNCVLQDFEFELVWKPKTRIMQISKEKKVRSPDLHEKLETFYHFSIQSKGSINLSCQISFTSPLYQDKIISKNIKLQKILLR